MIKSIPVSLKILINAHLKHGHLNNYVLTLAINGVQVLDKKCNNIFIRNALSSTPEEISSVIITNKIFGIKCCLEFIFIKISSNLHRIDNMSSVGLSK